MKQRALITGGAVRIGKAITLALAHAGYGVAIHYNRSAADAEALALQIRQAGGEAAAFAAPLDDEESVSQLIPEVSEAFGPLTCLINNASEFSEDELETMSSSQWDSHMRVNLKTPVFLAQAFAAQLPAGQHGIIINMIDQRVLRPNPQFFSYTVSKSALWAATKTMAQALAPRIRVNAIGPGPVLRSIHQSEDEFAREWQAMLLGHGAHAEEIAQAVLFFINAPAITGQIIALDGGQHLLWQTPDV